LAYSVSAKAENDRTQPADDARSGILLMPLGRGSKSHQAVLIG
jgi:hypothetical protein